PALLRAAALRIGRNRLRAKCLSVMPSPLTVAARKVVSAAAGRTTWIVRTRAVPSRWRSDTARTTGPSAALTGWSSSCAEDISIPHPDQLDERRDHDVGQSER